MTSEPFRRVAVIGLGYIGLPTAAVMALHGLEVIGVDIDESVVRVINDGKAHIVEPNLEQAVRGAVAAKRLRAVAYPEPADAFVVAVPTPLLDDCQPDVTAVEKAVRAVAPVAKSGDLLVIESTCPPGTTRVMAQLIAELRPDLRVSGVGVAEGPTDILVAYCPERVLPGRALVELIMNDRVVGGLDAKSAERAADLYRHFVRGTRVTTDAGTAEMVKLAENAFRDVNIAYANELSLVCERVGVDVRHVIQLANRHPRVEILSPGPGVGGHCISVDPWFLVSSHPDLTALMATARQVNDRMPSEVVRRVLQTMQDVGGRRVTALGLSYKADIDDLRLSPAIGVVRELASHRGIVVDVVEPHIDVLPAELGSLPQVSLVALDTALARADVVVVLVDHDAFRRLDAGTVPADRLVDTRGIWR